MGSLSVAGTLKAASWGVLNAIVELQMVGRDKEGGPYPSSRQSGTDLALL